jgi:type I restriction enzyme S subunit
MSEWRKCKLGELITLEYGKGLRDYREVSGKYEVFGTNGKIGFTGKYLHDKPSIIIGRKGAYRGVHLATNPFYVIDTAFYTKTKNESTDNIFLYFWLKDVDIDAMDSGSAIPSTSREEVYDLDIVLPPLPEQKAIASVLSSLDDKIDLLHRQNKTLEAMAETLFRQWFIEEAQDDWEEKSLYDCIELIGGGTPQTSVDEYWNGDILWISAKDITPNHKGVICTTEKKITREGLENSSTKILPKFSMIISARGTVGKYALLLEDMSFSQSNYGIIPKYGKCYFFTYLLVANVVDELISAAYGSVFDTITTKTFKEQYVMVPTEHEIINFEKKISPFFIKILNNSKQIRTLEKLRDNLLPKLMSGEVRVKYA